MAERIVVLGQPGTRCVPEDSTLVVGAPRHLAGRSVPASATTVTLGPLAPALDAIERAQGTVCVLASGDPGFFGIVRILAERFGRHALEVHPAPSSVAMAFARLGLPWDGAVVASAHGRPLTQAVAAVAGKPTAAVLTSPQAPPEAVARALLDAGQSFDLVAVASRLGQDGEQVSEVAGGLAEVAAGVWDWCSVLVLATPATGRTWSSVWTGPVGEPDAGDHLSEEALRWGRPGEAFAHRAGMVTRGEVRAVVLGHLALPAHGVFWDLGAGSGSVALEAALLRPGLRVLAVERNDADADRIEENATRLGAHLEVVRASAPAVLDRLPDPDRVFVGGGGLEVLDAALARLRPAGTVVAAFAALERAAAAADRLGHLVQLSSAEGSRLPGGGWRLAAANPVFVVWGPQR